MPSLLIDIGNSFVKTYVWEDNVALEETKSEDIDLTEISRLGEKYQIRSVMISSVRGDEEKVSERLTGLKGMKPVALGEKERGLFNERSCYSASIGSDRIAAYYGAEQLLPYTSKLIVDLGTAITIDAVDNKGCHQGGDITLGYIRRLKALHQSTALLPDIEEHEDQLPAFGRDTRQAIIGGALNGIVGEILYAYERGKKLYDTSVIIITGGDGKRFLPLLEEQGLNCQYDPWLLPRGLQYLLDTEPS